MLRLDPSQVREEFAEAFGQPYPTLPQLWFFIRFAKHIRGRCRNNAALCNFVQRSFPEFQCKQVEAVDERTGKKYNKMEVTQVVK